MGDTPTAATWRDTEPIEGAVGRLVLWTDMAVTLPVTIGYVGPKGIEVRIPGTTHSNGMDQSDWFFQVEQPPLPTAPGSVIEHKGSIYGCDADENWPWTGLSGPDLGQWRTNEAVAGATVLFDAGAVES